MTELTARLWPVTASSSCPLATSQSRAVLSQLPDARVNPFGANARAVTILSWPVQVQRTRADAVSQTRMVRSQLPDAMRRPEGWIASEVAAALWAVEGARWDRSTQSVRLVG